MTEEQEQKYEALVRSLCKSATSAEEATNSLNELSERLQNEDNAIIQAHFDIYAEQHELIPYS